MHPWITLGGSEIPTFLVVQVLNASLLLWWAGRRAGSFGFERKRVLDVTLLLLAAGLIGGRVFHILWEAPDYYREHPAAILNLNAGGYVYFGGFGFAWFCGWAYHRLTGQKDFRSWLDFFVPLISFGTAIGRFGCFLAGCCYGKKSELPWAVPLTDERGFIFPRHPAPIYLALGELLILAFLLYRERQPDARKTPGAGFALWLLLHGTLRFFVEFIRDDFRGPFVGPLSISQVICLVLILMGAGLFVRARRPA